MTQAIGVTYLLVPAGPVTAWHLALFYDDGAGNKKVIEVGPQIRFPEQLSFGQVAAEEQWSMANEIDGSPLVCA